MCQAIINANLRPNEFKLRQRERSNPIPDNMKAKVRELIAQGFSKMRYPLSLGAATPT